MGWLSSPFPLPLTSNSLVAGMVPLVVSFVDYFADGE